MAKDHRYKVVKVLIESGEIKTFQQIFDFIPKRVVYSDLGLNYARFQRLFIHPDLFTMRELITLAGLIDTDPKSLIYMAMPKKPPGKKPGRGRK